MLNSAILTRFALVLCFVGIFVSGVLSIGALFHLSVPCGDARGCDLVATHWTSHPFGFPNAYLGFATYLFLACATFRPLHARGASERALKTALLVSGVGAAVSLGLTAVSVVVIHASCVWCLASTGVMVVLYGAHLALSRIPPQPSAHRSVALMMSLAAVTTIALLVEGSSIIGEARRLAQGPQPDAKLAREVFVPKDAHVLGQTDAPITLVEFGDLLCPACQNEFASVKAYLRSHPARVRFVFRHYPLIDLPGHKQSGPAAVAAEIASERGRFWQYIDAIYSELREHLRDSEPVLDIAAGIGLNRGQTLARMQDERDPAFQRVMRDIEDGKRIGVRTTPTFFIVADGHYTRGATMGSWKNELDSAEYAIGHAKDPRQ
jgi:protein-disulfide isomerase